MEAFTKLKLGVGGLFLAIVAVLWAFGGIIGCIVAISRGDIWSGLFSLLIPAYGAIYTLVITIGAMF